MLVKILVILWQGGLVVINSFYEFSFGCEIRDSALYNILFRSFQQSPGLETDISDTWLIIDPLIFMLQEVVPSCAVALAVAVTTIFIFVNGNRLLADLMLLSFSLLSLNKGNCIRLQFLINAGHTLTLEDCQLILGTGMVLSHRYGEVIKHYANWV